MKHKIYIILLLSAACTLQEKYSYATFNKSMLDRIFDNHSGKNSDKSDKNEEYKSDKHRDPEEDYITEEEFENTNELDNQEISSNKYNDTNDTDNYFFDGEDYQPKAYDIRY